jgi:AcrR family transcriptional regulator
MPRPEQRVELILDAAQALILRQGLRGTSMEAIAAAAGIAKATLYAYFPDKQAVFAALTERVAVEWEHAFVAALDAPGPPVERLAAALVAKHKAVARLIGRSPHAAELYGAHEGGSAPRLAALDAVIAQRVEAELAAAGSGRPRLLAQVLLAAAAGIARRAQSAAELGPALRLLTERLVAPELGDG